MRGVYDTPKLPCFVQYEYGFLINMHLTWNKAQCIFIYLVYVIWDSGKGGTI